MFSKMILAIETFAAFGASMDFVGAVDNRMPLQMFLLKTNEIV